MKKIIRLTESDLHRIVNESVTRIISEKRNLQSQKLYDILQQHGGFAHKGYKGTVGGETLFSELTDDDIIGVMSPKEYIKYHCYSDYGMGQYLSKIGENTLEPSDYRAQELNDGYAVVYKKHYDEYRKKYGKRFDSRWHADGDKQYYPPTLKAAQARDLRNYNNIPHEWIERTKNGQDSFGQPLYKGNIWH